MEEQNRVIALNNGMRQTYDDFVEHAQRVLNFSPDDFRQWDDLTQEEQARFEALYTFIVASRDAAIAEQEQERRTRSRRQAAQSKKRGFEHGERIYTKGFPDGFGYRRARGIWTPCLREKNEKFVPFYDFDAGKPVELGSRDECLHYVLGYLSI